MAPEVPARATWIVLLLIVIAAAWLRGQGLDRLSLWIDEDLTALVARAIRATGWPLLPSGEAYTRGALYSYVVAGTTGLLGDQEAFLRLPSLVFSLGTIVVGYLYARALGGRLAGLFAALVLAASPWDLHYARMARMYSLLAFLVLTGVYLVHRGWIEGRPGSRIGAAVAGALAVPVHQLGMVFGLVYFLPHLPMVRALSGAPGAGGPAPERKGWAGGTRAGVLTSVLAIGALLAAKLGMSLFDRAAKAQGAEGLRLVFETGQGGGSLQIPFLPALDFNYSSILVLDYFHGHPLAGAGSVLGLVAATFFAIRGLRAAVGGEQTPEGSQARVGDAVTTLFWIGFVAMLWLNQFVLAAVFAGAVWLRSRRSRAWLPLALALGISLASLFLGRTLAEGPGSLTSRQFLRLFVALPVPFYRLLLVHVPAMFATTLLAGALAFRRARAGRDDGRFLLASVVLCLLLAMGLFQSPYVIHRYTFYLHPLLVVLYAVTWVDAARWMWRRGIRIAAVALLVLGLSLCEQFAPLEAWRATHVVYGYGRDELSDPDLTSHFRYDFRGAAEYLAANAGPDDWILSKDPVELRAYGIRSYARINALYSVYASNEQGEVVDWYLAIPILHTQEMLEETMERARTEGRRVFVVLPDVVANGPAVHLPPEMETFLAAAMEEHEVHRTPDGVTTILRFDP